MQQQQLVSLSLGPFPEKSDHKHVRRVPDLGIQQKTFFDDTAATYVSTKHSLLSFQNHSGFSIDGPNAWRWHACRHSTEISDFAEAKGAWLAWVSTIPMLNFTTTRSALP